MAKDDRREQLLQLLDDARQNEDDDMILEIETELFQMGDDRKGQAYGAMTDKELSKLAMAGKGKKLKMKNGGMANKARMNATSNRATKRGVSRGGGAALRGTKFVGVR